jgi:hypothetical protein
MTRAMQVPFDPENFLIHARSKREDLSTAAEDKIVELAIETINRFLENWDEYYKTESQRLLRVQEHIHRAIAGLIADRYQWEGDGEEYIPFSDEDGAYRWLEGDGDNPEADKPSDYLDQENDWEIRSLWDVAKSIDRQWSELDSWDEVRENEHWNVTPKSPSRLPPYQMELISHFSRIWHDHVDMQLGLPRKDPNPDNPLLRFVDAGMAICLGEKRPLKKTILQMVAKHIKPALLKEDEEEILRQEEENKMRERWDTDGVDFDEDFDVVKSPR